MRERRANGQIKPNTKMIDGVQHRLCSGPSHGEPTWLPDTDKYFYTRKSGPQKGYRAALCRLCRAWRNGRTALDEPGLVPLASVMPFIVEGVNRVGKMEFCRRVGIGQGVLYKYLHAGPGRTMRKYIARRVLLEVVSMRRKGEVRHRSSILRGATARSEPEKAVVGVRDYYRPHGDGESEARQRLRRKEAGVGN